jgi:DNA-binding PadR family transcriptional regulator
MSSHVKTPERVVSEPMPHSSRPRSPLWIVVLALACEEPMHPYRMQTLIKQRGKHLIANVAQRNSVYQTIAALRRAGLIEVLETSRYERRPERTTYQATDEGRRALAAWIRMGLSTPAREFPEFPAALGTLYGLAGPEELRTLLETRIGAVEKRAADLEKPVPGVPRLFLLEAEYMAATSRAEVKWLRGVVDDLRTGRLTYPSEEELLRIASEQGGPSEDTVRRLVAETAENRRRRGSGETASSRRPRKTTRRR